MQNKIGLSNRTIIFEYILENPGSHLREISRDLNIYLGTLRYHLTCLEKEKMIVWQKENNLKIYYANGEFSLREKRLIHLLRQKRFRDVILTIIDSPGLSPSEIADRLSTNSSTISKYIKILEDQQILFHEKAGKEKMFRVRDKSIIIDLLMAYKRSFWDTFVDNVLEIYFER